VSCRSVGLETLARMALVSSGEMMTGQRRLDKVVSAESDTSKLEASKSAQVAIPLKKSPTNETRCYSIDLSQENELTFLSSSSTEKRWPGHLHRMQVQCCQIRNDTS